MYIYKKKVLVLDVIYKTLFTFLFSAAIPWVSVWVSVRLFLLAVVIVRGTTAVISIISLLSAKKKHTDTSETNSIHWDTMKPGWPFSFDHCHQHGLFAKRAAVHWTLTGVLEPPPLGGRAGEVTCMRGLLWDPSPCSRCPGTGRRDRKCVV